MMHRDLRRSRRCRSLRAGSFVRTRLAIRLGRLCGQGLPDRNRGEP